MGKVVKIGRNETCPCGSGRKFKNCCGGNGKIMVKSDVPPQNRKLTLQGLQRLFVKVIEDMGGFDITFEELEKLSPNVALAVKHDVEKDSFRLDAVKVNIATILSI